MKVEVGKQDPAPEVSFLANTYQEVSIVEPMEVEDGEFDFLKSIS